MWKELVLAYLSQRLPQSSDELLNQAIECAPNEAVKQFLLDYQSLQLHSLERDGESVQDFEIKARSVEASLSQREDILVIRLVKVDGLSPLPYAYLHFPRAETREVLNIGANDVEESLKLSQEIGHLGLGCHAFYLTLKGKLLYEKRNEKKELGQAIESLRKARDIYEKNLKNDPTYVGFCGITYLHLMRAQRAHSNYPPAQRAGEKAISRLKSGTESSPNFEDHLALAERNLSSVLREIGDLDSASQLCQSALQRLENRLEIFGGVGYRKDRLSQSEYNAEVAMTHITLASILVKRARLLEFKIEEARSLKLIPEQPENNSKSSIEGELEKCLIDAMANLGLAQLKYNEVKNSNIAVNRGRLAMLHYTCGQVYEIRHNFQSAKNEYQEPKLPPPKLNNT